MARVIVKTLLIAVGEGTDQNEFFEKISEALDGVGFVADWKVSSVESEPLENTGENDLFENLWLDIPDNQVSNVWEGEDGDQVEVDPTFYQDNGTPVEPETGDDMTYTHTLIKL